MGEIVGDTACPQCRENGGDSTGNHLMLFDDGGGYCNRCGYIEPAGSRDESGDPTGEPVSHSERTLEESSTMTLEEVQKLPVAPLKARGIDKDICERYGVRVEYETTTGHERGYYYPITEKGKLVAYRNRGLPKRFSNVGDSIRGRGVDLFGQNTCQKGGKKLLICGGQDDMLAASQMLVRKYPNYPPNVVSLTNGENTKSVADNLDFINSYEEVLIYTDMDEVGRKCAGDIAKLIGDKARIVETSLKDANDMLQNGKQAEFINAFFSAKPYAPEGFVTVADVFEKATAMPTWGRTWPWPSLTKLTFGRRDGEGIYFGAGTKIGKSEAVNEIVHHLIKNNEKLALFKFEEDASMTVRKIAGKLKGKQFHKPDGDFTQEELIEGVKEVEKAGIFLYGKYGTSRWEDVEPNIRYAVSQGAKTILLDPLTRLVDADPSVANKQLIEISDKLSKLAKDLGFFYIIFTHLNAPATGKSHEEGGKVKSSQFTGSRSMMRACYYMVGLQRDKTAEDEIERNTTTFVLLEDRAFGNAGSFEVFYDRETGSYLEPVNDFKGDY